MSASPPTTWCHRALRWEPVHLDGDPDARPPIPPHIEVWGRLARVATEDQEVSAAPWLPSSMRRSAPQTADSAGLAADDWGRSRSSSVIADQPLLNRVPAPAPARDPDRATVMDTVIRELARLS